MSLKIGFYICHCGINIAGKVRVKEVADFIGELEDVAAARDYRFMCSDPGQEMIEKDIKELGLNRVVVASCSPRLHEKTFQGASPLIDLIRKGLKPVVAENLLFEQRHRKDRNGTEIRLCRLLILFLVFFPFPACTAPISGVASITTASRTATRTFPFTVFTPF